jgi:acyl dehydratase
MPIRTSGVGTSCEPQLLEVDARRTLAYAAGIGDANPRYLDDASDDVIAPPQFCVSVEWPAVLANGRINALGAQPDESLRGVHASQDSTFHRPIRPGDRLRTTLTVVEARAIRPGALTVSRIDTVDDATGEPVVTSYSSSIFRGVGVEGEPRRIDGAPPLPAGPRPHPTEKVALPIAREAPHVYTECAYIWNPIHTERQVALRAGLPDIILHGTATWALAGREIVRLFCGGEPLRLRRLTGRFAAMVIPGTTIEVEMGREGDVVGFEVRNAEGRVAISDGWAWIGAGA